MNCPSCKRENPPDNAFCGGCGARLDWVCPACARTNPPDNDFCGGCGGRSTRAPGGRSPQGADDAARRPVPDPRDYTPRHLAEKIEASKTALEGERKQVTVLFVDVKGSMDMAEGVDPEAWHRIMDRFFVILSEGVHRFEGTVNEYTGDGIMALFGAPIAHEDHAQRACYAALHLSDELRRYADELRLGQGLNFSVRMGMNSGEVVVGKIGDDLRMHYTAQGHTVGLASRMEQIAAPDRAYLTQNTVSLVEGFFRLRDLGRSKIKGVREPLGVYELQGVGPLRTRLDVSRARGFSRFVGRADEMASLEAAFARTSEGNGQVVGLVGEAGVGKSRLSYEFVGRCRAKGLEVNEAHGVAHGKMIPFLPVLELFRSYFGITEQDSGRAAREKIAGKLLLLEKELTEALPLLFDFLGVPDPERPVSRMDPEARQRQLFGAIKRLVHAEAQRSPGVMLVEDLHWIDGGSEAFLENFIEALPGTRTLLIVNFRPEYHGEWMQKSYYHQLPLLPLGSEAITALLDDLLGADASLGNLAHLVRERTGGNPFFIEEVVQSLVEAGSLQGTKGAYTLIKPVQEVVIPATVQTVLAARIDRLPEREKQVIQTAAVIGKRFPEPVLRGAADLPGVDLRASLRALIDAEFLYEEALYPEAEYAFKHPLTQEVAYHSQLADRRARVHGAVAQAMAELYPEKQDERAALVAHHWEGAGNALEAARWHYRAAEWAGVRDPGEALRHERRVRSLLEEVPESPETVSMGLMARIQILNFGWREGLPEKESARVFAEGKALAEKSGNPYSLAILLYIYSGVRGLAGEAEEGLKYGTEALRLAEEAHDPGLKLTAQTSSAYFLMSLGRLREALEFAEKALEKAPDDPRLGAEILGLSPYSLAFQFRALILMHLGRTKEALRDFDKAMQLAQEQGDMEILAWAHGSHAFVASMTGESQGAMGHARQDFEIAEKIGSSVSRMSANWALGMAHMLNEEWGEAEQAFERALAIMRQDQAGLISEGLVLPYLVETFLAHGKEDPARKTADDAIAVTRRRRTRSYECHAHFVLARVLLQTEGERSRSAIEAALAEATNLMQETGARCWEPFIHEERAELTRILGDDNARLRELREAHRLFTEMGATGHAERLAKELGI